MTNEEAIMEYYKAHKALEKYLDVHGGLKATGESNAQDAIIKRLAKTERRLMDLGIAPD